MVFCRLVPMRPPRTTVRPFCARTVLRTERLVNVGPTWSTLPTLLAARSVISWLTCRRTCSPSVIWGVKRRVRATSLRSTETLWARPVPPVSVRRLVMIGTLEPTMISASSLSEVSRRGAERMFTSEVVLDRSIRAERAGMVTSLPLMTVVMGLNSPPRRIPSTDLLSSDGTPSVGFKSPRLTGPPLRLLVPKSRLSLPTSIPPWREAPSFLVASMESSRMSASTKTCLRLMSSCLMIPAMIS